MIELRLSSVQATECDAMGHFNVRFYVRRAVEGLAVLRRPLGLGSTSDDESSADLIVREHHLRFIREMRAGTGFSILGGVIGIESEVLKIYQEFHLTADNGAANVTAAFLADLQLIDRKSRAPLKLPPALYEKAPALAVEPAAVHAPRGLRREPPRRNPSIAEAEALGLVHCLKGPVGSEDCDAAGHMRIDGYIARVWEGTPNLMIKSGVTRRFTDSRIGGAALEYRLAYRKTPRLGDLIGMWSGLISVGGRTTTWGHWLFDLVTGEPVATAETVAIWFDLETRKSVAIPEAEQRALARQVVPALSI
jgi:acyl-CoA thioester hydrolase